MEIPNRTTVAWSKRGELPFLVALVHVCSTGLAFGEDRVGDRHPSHQHSFLEIALFPVSVLTFYLSHHRVDLMLQVFD